MSKNVYFLFKKEIEFPICDVKDSDSDIKIKKEVLELCYSTGNVHSIFGMHFLYGQIKLID